ncbi:MAG: ribosome recycling factor [Spirochaetota bacterium]|uniref:ribosome recycling factor n=1 Tax=Gracilinema caldarium TaxID=215591 RepID=UPI0016ADA908|nr:ribosome recycling factor [Gracilinema caldarium]NLJ10565.1 ribosome recycling factor [Treponema sp.]HRS03045.1 ribosome recycling factor [Treponema sp.]HRU27633.1 ribosome recycling factor [Treponema sp.]
MHTAIKNSEDRMKKTIASLKDDLASIRTGRASAALFDKIRVDYYGEKSPLNQVANISIPEARLIVIQPWDRAMIGEIEKAIRTSELSLNPSNDGKVIRISIPPLTEERRKDLAKQAKNLAEQSRVAIRNIRRDGNEELKKAQKNGELTEDDESKAETELQNLTDKYIKEINHILEEKEKEIMEV